MADDLTQLVNIPDKDENSDVIKSPVIKALLSYFSRYSKAVVYEMELEELNHDCGPDCICFNKSRS